LLQVKVRSKRISSVFLLDGLTRMQ